MMPLYELSIMLRIDTIALVTIGLYLSEAKGKSICIFLTLFPTHVFSKDKIKGRLEEDMITKRITAFVILNVYPSVYSMCA